MKNILLFLFFFIQLETISHAQFSHNLNNNKPYATGSSGANSNCNCPQGKKGPLPIALVQFNAVLNGENALLTWQTANEVNTDKFEIERSLNATTWLKISEQKAAGESSVLRDYEFTDKKVIDLNVPIIYYRLRILELSEKVTYSPVRSIRILRTVQNEISSIFYNENNTLQITVIALSPGSSAITIIDMAGRILKTQVLQMAKGINQYEVSLPSNIPAGVYTWWLNSEGKNYPFKFVKY